MGRKKNSSKPEESVEEPLSFDSTIGDAEIAEEAEAAEAVAVEEEAEAPKEKAPTEQFFMEAGFTQTEASQLAAAHELALRGPLLKPELDLSAPHYRIRSAMPRGYWKVGRHFKAAEDTLLFVKDLSEEEIAELERANPLHVKIAKVGF